MDVFTALQTAVSGLKAQSFSLNNISGNIANSQTTGYKRIDTSFVDLIAEQTPGRQVAGTVGANSRLTTTIQGSFDATDIGTNMALNGNGFFVVQSKTSDANGQATFSTGDKYTRRGDFAPDKDGYLVNGGGSYLTGTTINPATGQASSDGPIRISNALLAARPTTTITYSANLPKLPATTNAASGGAGSEVFDPTGFKTNPVVLTGTGTGRVTYDAADQDVSNFIKSSITGPSLTVYSASGGPVSLSTRWAKVQSADPAATPPVASDVWNLFYANKSTVSEDKSDWINAGTAFEFNASGQLTSPTTTAVSIPNPAATPGVTVDGADLGPITLNYGSGGLTQYNTSDGRVTTNTQQQDGYASGSLIGTQVGDDGTISGTYSNGSTLALARIEVVQFANPDGLNSDSYGNYEQTLASGSAIAGLKGATIIGGNVERSNTDIASEFSKMIVTQQAYSANTKVMSTAQDMMSALINIIR